MSWGTLAAAPPNPRGSPAEGRAKRLAPKAHPAFRGRPGGSGAGRGRPPIARVGDASINLMVIEGETWLLTGVKSEPLWRLKRPARQSTAVTSTSHLVD